MCAFHCSYSEQDLCVLCKLKHEACSALHVTSVIAQESLPVFPSSLNVLVKFFLVFCLSSNISSFSLLAIDPVGAQSGDGPLCGPLLQGEVGLTGAPCTQGTYLLELRHLLHIHTTV